MIASLFMVIVFVANISVTVLADIGYDETAPIMKSFKVLNSSKIDARKGKGMYVEFNLVEECTGITRIDLWLEDKDGNSYGAEFDCQTSKKNPLFTGKKKVKLNFDMYSKNMKPGSYKVTEINLYDGNQNCGLYHYRRNPGLWKKGTKKVKIAKSNYRSKKKKDKTPPQLKGFVIKNPKNVDAEKGLTVSFDVKETGSGMESIGIGYEIDTNDDSQVIVYETCKKGNTKNLKYNIEESPLGANQIKEIVLCDKAGNESYYNLSKKKWKKYKNKRKFTVTKAPQVPLLNWCQIANREVSTPGLLNMDVEIGGTEKVSQISLTLMNQKGKVKFLEWNEGRQLNPGKHNIGFPVSPFWGTGKWKIQNITLFGKSGKATSYRQKGVVCSLESVPGFEQNDITFSTAYKISYYGSVGNSKTAVKKIKDMKSGQTAVLDCRYSKIAKKELFLAIRGKNKTLVFEDEDVQWIFNGKDIRKSRCKNIDLTTKIKRVKGKLYGYSDDPYILYMKYSDNGRLPGKVEMRVNYKYLSGKYALFSEIGDKNNSRQTYITDGRKWLSNQGLLLSYYDKGKVKILKEKVEVADDKYVEYQVTHNSTYLLSKRNPRLTAPSRLKAYSRGNKEIVLSWGRVGGAYGYKVYRSTSVNGTYKRIGSSKGNRKTSYVDKRAKRGKRYYYRVKASGASKKVKGSYSKKVSCKIWKRTY